MLSTLIESLVDNCVYDAIKEPAMGSVLYCDLLFGLMEHSGVYVGNNQIVELQGNGDIALVNPEQFMSTGTARSIYTSCNNGVAVGNMDVVKRAKNMLGSKRDYNLVFDNCHQFTTGCLTGDFENSNNFLWMLKDNTAEYLNANEWLVWNHLGVGL